MICSSSVAYTLSLYVYIHEAFIILSCYLNTTKNNQITDQITDLKNWSVITDQIMTI